jgi:uridine kinase
VLELASDEETISRIANEISLLAPSVGNRVAVGIDGCGGAGKSTLAAALLTRLASAQVIPTDDFASWDEPINWWPRMLEEVFRPITQGRPTRYRRYDWVLGSLAESIEVDGQILLIEGVSSTRREFRPYLGMRIWIECPAAVRLQRGLIRDGEDCAAQWKSWMASENEYVSSHRPEEGADHILSGL